MLLNMGIGTFPGLDSLAFLSLVGQVMRLSYARCADEERHADSKFLGWEHVLGLLTANLVLFACFRTVSWPVLRTPSAARKGVLSGPPEIMGNHDSVYHPDSNFKFTA